MGAATTVLAILGLHGPTVDQRVAHDRPQLVPTGITTRSRADSATAAAHPTHLATPAYRIDTACRGTYCVEELQIGSHVVIAPRAAIAELRRQYADPAAPDQTDATQIVLPQPSAAGYLSVATIESAYTIGAAHANNRAGCMTVDVATGRRLTLAEAIGPDAARRVVDAVRRWIVDHPQSPELWYRPDMTSFLLPAPNAVVLCDHPDPIIRDDGAPRVLPVQVR
jgi:hypothetical protein